MPQKYNPTVLELIRFHSSQSVSLAQSVSNILMKSHYGDVREVDQVWYPTFEALDHAINMMRLFGAVVDTMIIYKDRMLESAHNNYVTVSELADEIYRRTGLPYRTSHGIVVDVVNQALGQGMQSLDITSDMVYKAAEKVIGKPIVMSQEDVTRALDPVAFVDGHDVVGGPAPQEVLRMIGLRREHLAEARNRLAGRKARLEEGDRLLNEAVQGMINSVT